MKRLQTLWLAGLLLVGCQVLAQEGEQAVTKARFGTDKEAITEYFEPFFEAHTEVTGFKRGIFKIGIDANGSVIGVVPVNHVYSNAIEAELIQLISAMKWQPKQAGTAVGSSVFLVLIVDAEGHLKIELR